MSLAIAGMGWITPLGNGVDPVWKRLLQGAEAFAGKITEQFGDQSYSVDTNMQSSVTESILDAIILVPRSLLRSAVVCGY